MFEPLQVAQRIAIIERVLTLLASQRRFAIVLVGVTSLVTSVSFAAYAGIPQAKIHDEFSYLLAASTFAQGRLTNPRHPLWIHFESFHIIHSPTYASKYPPGQGLILAAGQVISGYPIVGVWLSTALACAALYWMFLAWLPARWALLGGLLSAIHPLIVEWSQSYWGGALAMGGGALVFGAFRRIKKQPCARDALLMGLGIAVMANTRPYEGFVFSLLIGAALLVWMASQHRPSVGVLLRRVVLPLASVLIPTAAMMGYYNSRITGDALRMPYMVHEDTYGIAPVFLWQALRPDPVYRHSVIRDFHKGWSLSSYTDQRRSIGALLTYAVAKGFNLAASLFAPLVYLLPSVIFKYALAGWLVIQTLRMVARDRRMRLPIIVAVLFVPALLVETWLLPHYAAPVVGVFLLLGLQAMRHLRFCSWKQVEIGRVLVCAIPVISIASLLSFGVTVRKSHASANIYRSQALAYLQKTPGRDLVIVRYGPKHSPHDEWVYNEAEIDSAEVVWAREMDPTRNRQLLEYFKERRAWLLEVDAAAPKLAPYPVQRGFSSKSAREEASERASPGDAIS